MRPLLALRAFALALASAALALLLLAGVTRGLAERRLTRTLRDLPDHDFTAEIRALHKQGRLAEALDWARYVTNNPALPGQAEAARLAAALESEQASLWHRADRIAKGFLTGSGASSEELGGAIAADMLLYGDCRDLAIQAFNRLAGHETDSVVAALAGVGLLTELVDAADWAPAVLKAFRKANALSTRMGDWLIAACRRSQRLRRLDPALESLFAHLRRLTDRLGTARAATVFRQADTLDDVATLARHADAHPGDLYRLLAVADRDGLVLLRRFGDAPQGLDLLVLATRKGPRGLDALRKGGDLRRLTLSARTGARLLRTLRLERPQRLLHALAMRSPAARASLWGGAAALLAFSLWQTLAGLRHLLPARVTPPASRRHTHSPTSYTSAKT